MKPISVIAIALLGFLLWSCSDGQKAAREQAEAEFRQGLDIMFYDVSTELPGERTHYVRALEHFERAMAADSTFAPAYAAAVVPYYAPYWDTGDEATRIAVEKKSRWALEKALEYGPDLAETKTAQAVLAMILGDVVEAEQLFKQALEAHPSYWDAHREYASLMIRTGRYEEALPLAERAREFNPRATNACTVVGDALQALGRKDEAEATLRSCIDMAPVAWPGYAYLGNLLFQSRDYDGVIEVSDAGIAAGQDRPWIRNNRAFAMAMKGDLEGALSEFEATGSPFGLGVVYARMGNRAKAMEMLEAIKANVEGGQWGYNWDAGVIQVALGDTTAGINHFEEWVSAMERLGPANAESGQWLSRIELLDPVQDNPRFQALVKRTGHTDR